MGKIKIEINEDFDIFISNTDPNYVSQKKYINIDTLYSILDECRGKAKANVLKKNVERDILYCSSLMPNYNGVHVLQHIIKNKNSEIVVLQRQPRRSRVAFYDEVLDDIGMPSLIFAIYLFNGTIQNAKVMAVKDELVREDTVMCRYPLTNVGEQGGVCFGNNDLREFKVESFNELHSFPNMFLMIPASHELSESQNTYGMHLRPLLNHLRGKDFDSSKLIETKFTYKEWINKYVER